MAGCMSYRRRGTADSRAILATGQGILYASLDLSATRYTKLC